MNKSGLPLLGTVEYVTVRTASTITIVKTVSIVFSITNILINISLWRRIIHTLWLIVKYRNKTKYAEKVVSLPLSLMTVKLRKAKINLGTVIMKIIITMMNKLISVGSLICLIRPIIDQLTNNNLKLFYFSNFTSLFQLFPSLF